MSLDSAKLINKEVVSIINIAEQLKLPFLQILREVEALRLENKNDLNNIETSAEYALSLLDNYLLSIRLSNKELEFNSEPVSISHILYESARLLEKLAKQYGVFIELDINGKFGPVEANGLGLQSAIFSAGSSLIEAVSANTSDKSSKRLYLASHKSRYGIVIGAYIDNMIITNKILKQGRALMGISRQPFPTIIPSAGAGILVADRIMKAMNLDLKSSRHNKLYGIGAVLHSNEQLQLV